MRATDVEGSRVVETSTNYSVREQTTRVFLTLKNGQYVKFHVSDYNRAEIMEQIMMDGAQGFVWTKLLNDMLKKNIVAGVKEKEDVAIIKLRNGLELAGPVTELFDDSTLATLLLLEAANGNDARG